jgi:Ca2+-binding EF-hand superfamily protein
MCSNSEEGGLNIPEDEIDKLISEVDFNNDNKIDYTEFLNMMKKDLKGESTAEAIIRSSKGFE